MSSSRQKRREKVDSETFRKVYLRLWDYSLRHRKTLIWGVILGGIGGISFFPLLESFQNLMSKVFNPERATWTKIITASLVFPLIGLVKGLATYFSTVLVSSVGYRVVTDLRNECFLKMQYLSLGHMSKQRAGDMISRISNDTTIVQQAVSSALSDLCIKPFILLALVVWLVRDFPMLSIFVFIVVPICILPVSLLGKKVKRFSRQNQERLAGMVSILQENIGGAPIVRAYGTEKHEVKKFMGESEAVYQRLMRIIKSRTISQPIMEVLTMCGLSLAFIYVYRSSIKIEDFFSFAAAVIMMYDPIRRLGKVHMTLQQASGAAERVFELLDTPIDVASRPDAVPFEGDVQSIQYRNVHFSYEDDPILRDINFTVKAGQVIAFVGHTGSGKTTLVNLLPRFYDLAAGNGEILLNGKNIRDYTLDSVRQQIGLVTQDTFLFNDTIASNIAYGDPNPDLKRIREAARQANAQKFIEEKPNGYDELIGDRGQQLSGGQRQRLALARALYRNAPILILDEATSALDTRSERLVQEAIDHVMEGRTVFAIAHRLSTIQHADLIVVLEAGHIVEAGTHKDLLKLGGHYEQLHSLQFQT